jgi:sugar phosphate isomerase/epimerase
MERRTFNKLSIASAAFLAMGSAGKSLAGSRDKYVRLGGPLFGKQDDPDGWIKNLIRSRYRAAYCPLRPGADTNTIRAYKSAAAKNDIVIAEVGAWSNMISPNDEEQRKSIDKCVQSLELADQVGANCCVNVSGSRNTKYWAGPHEDNLSEKTFDLVVEVTRKVIDAVKLKNTFFALEPMPWSFPDSPENYLKLIKAIDRKAFGVHFDPVNMVSSPQLYFRNGDLIRYSFKVLGPYIRSCHGKDIILREDNYIPQLDELQPGLGKLDYRVFLTELVKLKDIPLMMEHLKTEEEYFAAADYIRSVGKTLNIAV